MIALSRPAGIAGVVEMLTLPTAKAGGCSVHHGSYRHRSLTGLPGPEKVAGRVRVAVQHHAAGAEDVGASTQTLGHTRPTAATVLAGVLSRDPPPPLSPHESLCPP